MFAKKQVGSLGKGSEQESSSLVRYFGKGPTAEVFQKVVIGKIMLDGSDGNAVLRQGTGIGVAIFLKGRIATTLPVVDILPWIHPAVEFFHKTGGTLTGDQNASYLIFRSGRYIDIQRGVRGEAMFLHLPYQ